MGAGLFIWSERIYIIKKYPPPSYIQIIFTDYQNTSSTYISSGEMVLTANGNADSGDAQLNLSTYTATTIRALSIRT